MCGCRFTQFLTRSKQVEFQDDFSAVTTAEAIEGTKLLRQEVDNRSRGLDIGLTHFLAVKLNSACMECPRWGWLVAGRLHAGNFACCSAALPNADLRLAGPSCWHSSLPALGALEQVVRHTSTLSTK